MYYIYWYIFVLDDINNYVIKNNQCIEITTVSDIKCTCKTEVYKCNVFHQIFTSDKI